MIELSLKKNMTLIQEIREGFPQSEDLNRFINLFPSSSINFNKKEKENIRYIVRNHSTENFLLIMCMYV